MNFNYSGMILAAGFGKRMLPLTKNLPKSLIKINNITLLENTINFLDKLGCNEIIINTHFQHLKIEEFIKKRKDKKIKLIYEKIILDTGGAIKNACSIFKNENIIVVNSDIFWHKKNIIDAEKLIHSYEKKKKPQLLLVNKNRSFGINKIKGDFILKKNKISRFDKGNEILYYSGLQVLHRNIFKNFKNKIFSLNIVWDYLILNDLVFGITMKSKWYHVGDIQGLEIVKKLPLDIND